MHPRRAALAFLAASVIVATACAGTGSASDRTLSQAIKPLPAGVNVQTDVTEYVVTGRTIQELTRAMRELGMESGGRRWAGVARSRTTWRFEYERQVARCAFKDVTVNVVAQVDMPRWARDSTADPQVVAWWEAMERRLFDHEVGHVRIALDGARAVREATRLMTGGSCDELGTRANLAARELMARSRDAQAEYDLRTAHGTRPDTVPARRRPR
jgi:predicted secreted Zn-dependent protease